jgi:hypothetical protein
VWSDVVGERLRARYSGQLRIVGLAYLGGGGLAAVGLVVVSLFIPATALVRETLSLPLAQLVDQWLQAAAGPGRPGIVESTRPPSAVLVSDAGATAAQAAPNFTAAEAGPFVAPVASTPLDALVHNDAPAIAEEPAVGQERTAGEAPAPALPPATPVESMPTVGPTPLPAQLDMTPQPEITVPPKSILAPRASNRSLPTQAAQPPLEPFSQSQPLETVVESIDQPTPASEPSQQLVPIVPPPELQLPLVSTPTPVMETLVPTPAPPAVMPPVPPQAPTLATRPAVPTANLPPRPNQLASIPTVVTLATSTRPSQPVIAVATLVAAPVATTGAAPTVVSHPGMLLPPRQPTTVVPTAPLPRAQPLPASHPVGAPTSLAQPRLP